MIPSAKSLVWTRGWTLFNLLVSVCIVAILLSLALPAFDTLMWNQRRVAATNDLVASLHLARSEAIKRAQLVVLCPLGAPGDCLERSGEWPNGWMVFVNLDRDNPPRRDPGEPVVREYPGPEGVSVLANREAFVMRPAGVRSTNGTVSFCDPENRRDGRAVVISYTGRPRTSDRDLRCPSP
jgi:type IV fimbrial biogenesis protein FimT